MHVLHLVDGLALGGAERMLVEIANRSVADGHRVTVCISRSDTTLASRLRDEIRVLVLGRTRTFDLWPLRDLIRDLRANDIALVHCHGRSSFSLACALRAAWAIHQPLLLHDHYGVEIDSKVPSWFAIARRWCAAYVGVYQHHRAWASKAGIPSSRTFVIPNALDLRALVAASPSAKPADGQTLIAIGGIRREKAFDVLIEAMTRLRSPVQLSIVGGDADKSYAAACRAQVRNSNLASRVLFLGPRNDALSLARGATLAVHSSRSESGPLVLAEYATLRVPFVATRVGGIAAILAEADAGRFVAPEDPAALASAIDEMLEIGVSQRASMLDHSEAVAFENFDIGSAMPNWYRVYESALAR